MADLSKKMKNFDTSSEPVDPLDRSKARNWNAVKTINHLRDEVMNVGEVG